MSNNLAISDTYEETKMLIFQVSHRMSTRYFLPFEEVLGQAHLIFVKSFYSYDTTFGTKFTSWLQSKLQWGLTTWLQEEYRSRIHTEIKEEDFGICSVDQFYLRDMLSGMSGEARMIVKLVCDSPMELVAIMELTRVEGRRQIRRTLREYIQDRFQWAAKEVNIGFAEIRSVLTDKPMPDTVKNDPTLERLGLTKAMVWTMTRKYRP